MIPRQTTLCVPHFIEYAVAKYGLEQESPDSKKKQAKTQSRASAATRVQPRRAAKQVRKSYVESSSEPEDLNDNDNDDEQHAPESKIEKAETVAKTVQSTIDRVIDQLPQDRTGCIFGPRPWICESCREEKATTGKSQVQYDKTDTRQPEAAMESGMGLLPDGELLLDWSDVSVSSSSIFRLEGHRFTVDTCWSPMVMRLQ